MCFLSIEVIVEADDNQLKKLLIFISNKDYVTFFLILFNLSACAISCM